jgi:hypothetical protein
VAGLFPAVSISEENFAASEEDCSFILRPSQLSAHVTAIKLVFAQGGAVSQYCASLHEFMRPQNKNLIANCITRGSLAFKTSPKVESEKLPSGFSNCV